MYCYSFPLHASPLYLLSRSTTVICDTHTCRLAWIYDTVAASPLRIFFYTTTCIFLDLLVLEPQLMQPSLVPIFHIGLGIYDPPILAPRSFVPPIKHVPKTVSGAHDSCKFCLRHLLPRSLAPCGFLNKPFFYFAYFISPRPPDVPLTESSVTYRRSIIPHHICNLHLSAYHCLEPTRRRVFCLFVLFIVCIFDVMYVCM